jgi:hypothetical protein
MTQYDCDTFIVCWCSQITTQFRKEIQMKIATRGCLLLTYLCAQGFWNQSAASAAQANEAVTVNSSNGVLYVNQLRTTFTVNSFQVVNGVTEAVGVLSAQTSDGVGLSVDILTNTPVKMPVILSGALAGKESLLASEPVPPPTLSTNLCTILAISIEFVDVVIPGLGLNVHVNQLLIGVRADRETRLGDVLCTLLGDDPAGNNAASITPRLNMRMEGNSIVVNTTEPATLQSAPSLTPPVPWKDVATVGPGTQTVAATGPLQFFRLAFASAASQASKGAFSLGRLGGVFTVADFKSVNGSSQAAGWLTANVTDGAGSEVGKFTNFPVRLPVSGVLAGEPVELGMISDPVILPELSTNTCSLLGVVIGAIDVTIPGLGLNVHVNEISLVVRADRETTVGDLLCTLLGDDLLGSAQIAAANTATANSLAQTSSNKKNLMSPEQLRGLAGIFLGPGVSGPNDKSSKTTPTLGSSAKDLKLGLVQKLVHQVIRTVKPKAAVPAVDKTSLQAVP